MKNDEDDTTIKGLTTKQAQAMIDTITHIINRSYKAGFKDGLNAADKDES